MKKINLKIITPERLILEEKVDQVSLPTEKGEITILPDHIPLITKLTSGDIVAVVDGESLPIAVVGGFLEVKKTDKEETEVAILADFAEHLEELSEEKIIAARAKADELREQIKNKEVVDFEHFATELERSLTRVRIADKWKNKKYRK
jgi:F-type H+-transporting ATPase subunit epsilon